MVIGSSDATGPPVQAAGPTNAIQSSPPSSSTTGQTRTNGAGSQGVSRPIRDAQHVWRLAHARAKDETKVAQDRAVYDFLKRRGFGDTSDLDLFGILGEDMRSELPYAYNRWPGRGYCLICPLYDCHGNVRCVQARRVLEDDTADPLETVLAAVGEYRQRGDQYVALCPSHDDHNPSLAIARGRNGGVVMKCRVRCDTKQVVHDLGLKMTDLAPPHEWPKTMFPGKGVASGSVFADRRGLEVLRGASQARCIIVGEGLTDHLCLSASSQVPTISIPGTGFVRNSIGSWVKERTILLAFDCDSAGQSATQQAARSARRHGATAVKRITWPKPANDACDCMAALGPRGMRDLLDGAIDETLLDTRK